MPASGVRRDWNPHAAPFAGTSPFALPFSRDHFPNASRTYNLPPISAYQQLRKAFTPTLPTIHSASMQPSQYQATSMATSPTFDWPEAAVSRIQRSTSPAPSYHSKDSDTDTMGLAEVTQYPDAPRMNPDDEHRLAEIWRRDYQAGRDSEGVEKPDFLRAMDQIEANSRRSLHNGTSWTNSQAPQDTYILVDTKVVPRFEDSINSGLGTRLYEGGPLLIPNYGLGAFELRYPSQKKQEPLPSASARFDPNYML